MYASHTRQRLLQRFTSRKCLSTRKAQTDLLTMACCDLVIFSLNSDENGRSKLGVLLVAKILFRCGIKLLIFIFKLPIEAFLSFISSGSHSVHVF